MPRLLSTEPPPVRRPVGQSRHLIITEGRQPATPTNSAHLTYLRGDVSKLNVLLQVTHHHEVSGLGPVIVEGVVVDVTQDGTDTDPESNVTRASIKQLHNFYLKHTTDSVMCLHLNAQEGHFYCTLHVSVKGHSSQWYHSLCQCS